MPASWVAASTRARLLGDRRIGRLRAAAIANSGGLGPALQMLQASPYGANVDPGMSLEAAQRQVAATILWNLRVLAGWLPPGGSAMLLPLAAWFEIANIEERLAYLSGDDHVVLISSAAWESPGERLRSDDRRRRARGLAPLAVGRPRNIRPEWHGAGAALQVGWLGCRLCPGCGRVGGDCG